METRLLLDDGRGGPQTLETSLVEWKQYKLTGRGQVQIDLGNFLSGMETRFRPQDHIPGGGLGNFLSGMET